LMSASWPLLLVATSLVLGGNGENSAMQRVENLRQRLQDRNGQEVVWPKGESNHFSSQAVDSVLGADHRELAANPVQRFETRRACVAVLEWLSRHHPSEPALREDFSRHCAYELRLWPDHSQWAEEYIEEFWNYSRPIWPIEDLPQPFRRSVEIVQEGWHEVVQEYLAAKGSLQKQEHNEGIHVTGMWELLYVDQEAGKCLKTPSNSKFPSLCRLLSEATGNYGQQWVLPHGMRFATLHPNTYVVRHTASANDRLKMHCCIENPANFSLQIANLSYHWEAGKCVIIDDSFAHEINATAAGGSATRTIVEFKLNHFATRIFPKARPLTPTGYNEEEDEEEEENDSEMQEHQDL